MGMEGWTLIAREQIASDEWIVLHGKPDPLKGPFIEYSTHREVPRQTYYAGDYFAGTALVYAVVNFCKRAGKLGLMEAVLNTALVHLDKEEVR